MKSANKRFLQKAIAVIVIVTLLYGAGVAPVVMLFLTGVALVVFLVSRRSQHREIEQIFEFYIAADAILRDEDRRWYGFEVAEVIEQGEELLGALSDPPPLLLFTLGALHHLVDRHSVSAEYLSSVVDGDNSEERYHVVPSPQLRRYVTLLRRIEADPSIAPQALGAFRSLERMRRRNAFHLLAESRRSLKTGSTLDTSKQPLMSSPEVAPSGVRQPIQEVLNDIYHDDDQSPSH